MPLGDGRFLAVLDRDPRNGGDETLAEIQGLKGELPETVSAESGGGGGHYLFGSPAPMAAHCAGPGLDALGSEKYFLVAPSRHASGGSYLWSLGAGPEDVVIADAPAWLLEGALGGAAGARPARIGEGTARDTILGEAFALAGMLGPVFPDGNCAVKCPWAAEHSDARGMGEDTSTVILPPAGGSRFGGFSCKHGHCANRKWHDVMKALPAAAVAEAQRKYPLRPVAVSAVVDAEQDAEPEVKRQQKRDELQEVREKIHYLPTKGGNGFRIKNDIVNLITILIYDPRWKDILEWDEFTQVLRFKRPPTWHADDAGKEQSPVWTDMDTVRLDAWLRRNWGMEVPNATIGQAAYIVARRQATHPLRDYLTGLVWDGTPRLEHWLSRYLGSPDTPYEQAVGRKWMLSAVARGLQPGCKADHVLILEGEQGRGKSTALASLMPFGDWFSDTPFDIGNKDAYMALRGKWIIELAELASLSKAEADRSKAFFSSPSDSYRPPYGRENVTVPRCCVFAGSVNLGEYLRDETGNRRYWPVACGVIDTEALAEDRDQIWAEAVSIYQAWVGRGSRAGECLWWPTFEERPLFERHQADREEVDDWATAIQRWVNTSRAQELCASQGFLTTVDVATMGLDMKIADVSRAVQTRIGVTMMRSLRWYKRRVSVDGVRVWVYSPSR
jgi:predicted P-loop ATPase